MSGELRCRVGRLIDRHFAGTISPAEERAMRDHLDGCEPCRRYYERSAAVSALLGDGPGPRVRLGRGLGLVPRRRATVSVLASGAVLAAAASLLLVLQPAGLDSTFTRRSLGPEPGRAVVEVFDVSVLLAPTRVRREISPDAELAFAYSNAGDATHLLLFATDAQGRVYWYFPAWLDGDANPAAIPIEPNAALAELPEAISHELPAQQTIRLFALFLDEPMTVRELEERLPEDAFARESLPVDAVAQWTRTLYVRKRQGVTP